MEWINAKLLPEHIVVRSLEEDIFDGLILHHLFRKRLLPGYMGLGPSTPPPRPSLAPSGPRGGLLNSRPLPVTVAMSGSVCAPAFCPQSGEVPEGRGAPDSGPQLTWGLARQRPLWDPR